MPARKRLSLEQKAKLIEETMKPGFDRTKAANEFGIARNTISKILKSNFYASLDLEISLDLSTYRPLTDQVLKSRVACTDFQINHYSVLIYTEV